MKVLLVEPWFGGSHRAWAEGYRRHSTHDVGLVAHEDRFWRWRMRGGAVTLAGLVEDHVADHGRPDVAVVSGMVDVAGLLGQLRRTLADVPVALYLHESQLTYPIAGKQQPDRETSLVNWTSMVAADRVFVNSQHHRRELFGALDGLLDQAPDHDHRGLLAGVDAKTGVLPVGVELGDLSIARRRAGRPPLVLWNHRWDHDKNPEAFFAALDHIDAEGTPFRLAVVGESHRAENDVFDRARDRFADRIVVFGHLPRAEYVELLARADVVVSCARHEFFGIAMVEAMACGAVPVLPDRLSYPELVPDALHPWCLYPEGGLRQRLAEVLGRLDEYRSATSGLAAAMASYDWCRIAPLYDAALGDLAGDYGGAP